MTKPIIAKKLTQIPIKSITGMGYTSEAAKIMKCWEFNGGKVPKRLGTKILDTVKDVIDELMNADYNAYECVEKNPEIRFKKWKTKEIIDCINFHCTKMNKSIMKLDFPTFVLAKTYQKGNNSVYSHLLRAFADLQIEYSSEKSDYLRNQLIPFNNNGSIPEKVFIRTAAWLDSLNDNYVLNPCLSMDSISKMFIRHVKLSLSNTEWKIGYMAGESFQNDFLNKNIRCNAILTKKTLAQWEIKEAILYKQFAEDKYKRCQEEFTNADIC